MFPDANCLTAKHTDDRCLLDGTRTALSLQKTALEQHALADTKDRQKFLADKAIIQVKVL